MNSPPLVLVRFFLLLHSVCIYTESEVQLSLYLKCFFLFCFFFVNGDFNSHKKKAERKTLVFLWSSDPDSFIFKNIIYVKGKKGTWTISWILNIKHTSTFLFLCMSETDWFICLFLQDFICIIKTIVLEKVCASFPFCFGGVFCHTYIFHVGLTSVLDEDTLTGVNAKSGFNLFQLLIEESCLKEPDPV